MPTVYLVRHGRAAAGFDSHRDPGLDELGHRQAEATALRLADEIGAAVPIYTSPLARARQTAAPLAARWRTQAIVEPRIAEIPAPVEDLRQRGAWLRGVIGGKWADLAPPQRDWRDQVIAWLLDLSTDAVAFCHFIPINVAVAAATKAEQLVVFRPDNGSVTRLRTQDGELTLLERGDEAQTHIN